MRLLILGGDGMLGHQLLESWRDQHEVIVTLHRPVADYAGLGLFTAENARGGVAATDLDRMTRVVDEVQPDVVINAIGIVKQRDEAKAAVPSIEINALLPHRLAALCQTRSARLIQISTDCVFSGRTGNYRETDVPDPVDLYGRSKLLGEVHGAPALTLRTSIIGLELSRRTGLIEWYLAQRGTIRGFRRAIYTGLTTRAMARQIEWLLSAHPQLHGVWQIGSAPIDKFALLSDLAGRLDRKDPVIVPNDTFVCDRSFRSDALSEATGYVAPRWHDMLEELAQDIAARERRAGRGE